MKFIIMPRGFGKTSAACREAVRLGCPILTAFNKDIYRKRCKELGLPPVPVHTVQEVIEGKFYSSFVVVDDVDAVFRNLLKAYGIVPTLCTMSLEDQTWGGEY